MAFILALTNQTQKTQHTCSHCGSNVRNVTESLSKVNLFLVLFFFLEMCLGEIWLVTCMGFDCPSIHHFTHFNRVVLLECSSNSEGVKAGNTPCTVLQSITGHTLECEGSSRTQNHNKGDKQIKKVPFTGVKTTILIKEQTNPTGSRKNQVKSKQCQKQANTLGIHG